MRKLCPALVIVSCKVGIRICVDIIEISVGMAGLQIRVPGIFIHFQSLCVIVGTLLAA